MYWMLISEMFISYLHVNKSIYLIFTGADPAFLIRDLIQKFSCQVLGNYSKEYSFL